MEHLPIILFKITGHKEVMRNNPTCLKNSVTASSIARRVCVSVRNDACFMDLSLVKMV